MSGRPARTGGRPGIAIMIQGVAALALLAAAQSPTVIVRPVEIHDVLVNPGMGIQTFQRFNGQPINPGRRWSEVGPTERVQAAGSKPDFPDSSIAYFRWFWTQLEPEQGKYQWEVIDLALEEARRHHQKLAFRLMPYDEGHPLPEWYRLSGARRINKPGDPDGKVWAPDSADPLYRKYWGALVAEAGQRYDGHPFLDSVDISTFGYWGEGWGPYPPDWDVQKQLIDQYFAAFRRTPLLMNFDVLEALAYATRQGAGWRLDCWGDMGRGWTDRPNWSHMLDRYPQQVVKAGAQDVWQRSPVSLETCWTPVEWHARHYDLDYILAQALRWHASSVNIKSTAIPEEWKKAFDEFQKRMGYRFVLRKLEYPRSVKAGSMVPVSMWWLNAGVAPVYEPYALALRLRSAGNGTVIETPADIRKWLPGDAVFDDTVFIPATLKPGSYRLGVALLDTRTGQPAIRLAIQGRGEDGWYELGDIDVQ